MRLAYNSLVYIVLLIKYVYEGTAITGFGILQPSGHVDIYANNGNFQPGCPYVEPSISLLELSPETSDPYALGCSHARAREIFRDSLISSCQAVAYECSDYDTFKQVIKLYIQFFAKLFFGTIAILCYREIVILVEMITAAASRLLECIT